MTGDLAVPDEAYGVGWNGSLEVPTKNAIYDKIETIVTATPTMVGKRYFDTIFENPSRFRVNNSGFITSTDMGYFKFTS
jgi:hypothetical protein